MKAIAPSRCWKRSACAWKTKGSASTPPFLASPAKVVFTTHTPVPAGHDRFDARLVEEHIGPLREALGLSQDSLLGLGRENPTNSDELFCMTVLALRLSRRANAVSALHGEVSRAMWTGLFKGKAGRRDSHRAYHQRSACSVLACSADVPAL